MTPTIFYVAASSGVMNSKGCHYSESSEFGNATWPVCCMRCDKIHLVGARMTVETPDELPWADRDALEKSSFAETITSAKAGA